MITRLLILLTIIWAVILIVLFVPSNITLSEETPTYTPRPISGIALSSKVNEYRESQGLPSLPQDENLCIYAEKRTQQIKTDWSHNPFTNNQCAGTGYSFCGENLAKDYFTEDATLNGWIESPEHLDNIKDNWSATCVKCSDNYCVQEFGI